MRPPMIPALVLLSLSACTPEIARLSFHLSRPVDIAVICKDDDTCSQGKGVLTAYVINSQQGSLARLDLHTGEFYDDDAFIPGLSPIPLGDPSTNGGRPTAIVAHAATEMLYISNSVTSRITRVDAKVLTGGQVPDGAVVHRDLAGRPADVILAGDVLFAALPDRGEVARIPLADFHSSGVVETISVAGSPYSLAADSTGEWLFVGHADKAYVSVVELATGSVHRVGIADECFDDLDNDGDGIVDAGDWGCRWLATPVEAAAPAGWTMPEIPTLPGDSLPRCMNGIDDDGDGAVDFPDDADCRGPTASLEVPGPNNVLARLAISGDDSLLYVVNVRDRTLVAIDVKTPAQAFRIDINAEGMPGANRLYRRLGREDNHLGGVPTDVVFALPEVVVQPAVAEVVAVPADCIEAVTKVDEVKDRRLRAYVSSTTGSVTVYEVADNADARVHQLLDADAALRSTIGQTLAPRLFVGSTELALGGDRRAEQPSFGEFLRSFTATIEIPENCNDVVDVTLTTTYYGIEVDQDDPRVARTEAWTVSHGGAILERDVPLGALDSATGDFVTPEGAFCGHGVEIGDLLRVRFTPDPAECTEFPGREFLYAITSVSDRRLGIEAAGYVIAQLDGADEATQCSDDPAAADVTLVDNERDALGDAWPGCADGTNCVFGRCRKTVPAMTASCFGEAMAYSVHVPAGSYAVIGSTSGYLHRWSADENGECQEDPNAKLTGARGAFVGRATEWALKAGAELPACPLTNAQSDDLFEGPWFENHALTFRMLPGCVVRGTENAALSVSSDFDVRWEFGVNSSFGSLAIGARSEDGNETLGNPRRLRAVGPDSKLYAVDAGQQKVVEISAGIDRITAVFR